MINIREFLGLGYFTSNLDTFIAEFNQKNHKLSASQRDEIEKYSRIYALRDNPSSVNAPHHNKTLWNKF